MIITQKKANLVIALFFLLVKSAHVGAQEIPKYLLAFKGNATITNNNKKDRLPSELEKFRTLPTISGLKKVSRLDGYRIIYNINGQTPFVNLKIEMSDSQFFSVDKKNLIDHYNYIIAISNNITTQNMVTKIINGYKIYGYNCTVSNNKILGSYIFFLKNNIIVYAYFLNYGITNNPNEYASFLKLQNTFLNDFTNYLKSY